MTILEILEAHYYQGADFADTENRCSCGHRYGDSIGAFLHPREMHHAHVAEVLDKHMQEREAEAWDRLVGYAPFTAFERVRLRCENPFREEPSDD